jgi:hypothetical protein
MDVSVVESGCNSGNMGRQHLSKLLSLHSTRRPYRSGGQMELLVGKNILKGRGLSDPDDHEA